MELLSVIRRWRFRQHFSIREIARRTGLSRNTVRKYLRTDSVEPKFSTPGRPSGLDPYPQQTHEMLFDAHNHAFRVLGGVPRRGGLVHNLRSGGSGDPTGGFRRAFERRACRERSCG